MRLNYLLLVILRIELGAGIAQWVERTTEKPGAILKRVRVLGVALRDLSLRVSFQCRLSLGVRTAAGCYRMHQHLCAR